MILNIKCCFQIYYNHNIGIKITSNQRIMGCGGSKSHDQFVPSIRTKEPKVPSIRIQEPKVEKLTHKNEEKLNVLDEAMKLIGDIKLSFNQMDLDQNGYLSKEELKQGYRRSAHFENLMKRTIERKVTRFFCGYLTKFFEKMPKSPIF